MSFPAWPPVDGGPRSVFDVDDDQSRPVVDGRCDVGAVEELPPGSRRIVRAGGERGIGLFNVDGRYYAIRNVCPHKGAPLCRGRLRPHIVGQAAGDFAFEREGEIIKCPWHQWEFDLGTGWSLYAPRMRVRTYPVTVEAGRLILHLADDEARSAGR